MNAILAIAAFVLPLTVAAQEEVGLKDFVLGGDMRAEAARAGLTCEASRHGGEWCYRLGREYTEIAKTIAGVPTKSLLLAGYENRLGWISFTFDQNRFLLVKSAFAEKYPSMQCKDSVVENRMGAKFDQTECEVTSPAATLLLRRRSTTLSEGKVELRSKEYEQRMRADFDAQKGQAKKDI